MNKRLVCSLLGRMLLLECALMAPSLLVAVIYGEHDVTAFLRSMALLLLCGLPMALLPRPDDQALHEREGFAVVGLSWILMSLFGGMPFLFSGSVHTLHDAFFECVSGFTTTGATILTDVEVLPRGILFWRSFTHWIGGMGVLVFTLALLPKVTGRSSHLARAESPGPSFAKLVPRTGDTAKVLYFIYAILTLTQVILLCVADMPLYDSLIHAFGTAGTGGFSNRNLSVGAYGSAAIDWIITIFMFLFGMNFLFYFKLLHGDPRGALRNGEIWVYAGLAVCSILLVTLSILPRYGDFFTALRYGAFQVGTVMSTTGYATADFNLWPQFTKALLVTLMVIGSCAGSTAGGVKVVRVTMLFKSALREVRRAFQPRKVKVLKIDGKAIGEDILTQTSVFFFIYASLLALGTLACALDGADLETAFTASISCLSNIGPGLSRVGPMGNFAFFSAPVKVLLSFLMLAGRLEFFPLLVLFHPALWRSRL